MADQYYDYNVDPFNSDAPDYIRVQSTYYSGDFGNRLAPSSPNYPLGTPTRYFLTLPGIIDTSDLTGARPMSLRDVTGTTNLTRVTGSPGVNEYRISPSSSTRRNIVELNASQAADEIGFDFYMIGSMPGVQLFGQETIKVASSDSYSNGNSSYIIQTTQDAGTEISALITELNSNNGGTIFLEEGTYNSTAGISMASNVNLIGQGSGSLFVYTGSSTAISISGSNNNKIENLNLDGTGSSTSTGIIISGNNITIKDCLIHDFIEDGIDVSSGRPILINNVTSYNNDIGVNCRDAGVKITECTVYDNTNEGVLFGPDNSVRDSILEANEIYSNGVGVSVQGTGSLNEAKQVIISDNVIRLNTAQGIYINWADFLSITGNIIRDNTGDGIEANNSKFSAMTGNNIYNNGAIGIEGNNMDNATIGPNIVYSNTTNQINLDASCLNNILSGNQTSTSASINGVPPGSVDSGTNSWIQNT